MMNQAQYNTLVAILAEGGNLNLAREAVADLLESYEVVDAALDGLCATGHSIVNYGAFEALYDDRGEKRVELVCHASTKKGT